MGTLLSLSLDAAREVTDAVTDGCNKEGQGTGHEEGGGHEGLHDDNL